MVHRLVALVVAGLLSIPLVPIAAAEDPTSGQCDRVNVPLNVNVGKVCARAGVGTNASCPPNSNVPITVTCSSLNSWSWLAYSSLNLPGEVTVTIHRNVQVCLDLVGAPPTCEDHELTTTETCAWESGEECRGSGLEEATWGPVSLGMGEEYKVLVHVDIHMEATSSAAGLVPVGSTEYGDFSDSGAAVGVVDDGRG